MLKLLARGIIKARFAPHSEDGAKNSFFARQLWLAANFFTSVTRLCGFPRISRFLAFRRG